MKKKVILRWHLQEEKKKTNVCYNLCIIDAYVWVGGLMFEVAYITLLTFFSDCKVPMGV